MSRTEALGRFWLLMLLIGVGVRIWRDRPQPPFDCPSGSVRFWQPPEGVSETGPGARLAEPIAACRSVPPEAVRVPPPAGALLALGGRIDLRCADREALELVRGVGPTLSRRLEEARLQSGRGFDWRVVDAVRGVGPVLLGRLRGATRIGDGSSCRRTVVPVSERP